jgi:outer membrane protein TolC
MRFCISVVLVSGFIAAPAIAQTSQLSRAAAIQTALDRGARLGVAGADTAIANAALITARAYPNPSFTASYSKAVPDYHFNLDIPLDFPMLRKLRIQSSQAGVRAAQLRYQFNRAMIAMEADTTYTRAVAARERLALSRRTALDADSLLHMVERRRDAGDASDMDVELARVNAGQQANIAASDSLSLTSAMFDLQAVLGLTSDSIEVKPVDSLVVLPDATAPASRSLDELAADLSLESAKLNERLQHRSIWSQFSLALGVETGDPDQHGALPTFGIGFGLPLFDRNRGPIAQAEAERAKAQAELTLAGFETRNALSHAMLERKSAISKVTRDAALVASANHIAAMSLTAYREGALSLPNVLEAQRSAREILAQYTDDLAAAWIATAELRVFSITPTHSSQLP